jgi:hypothetical protein
MENAARGKCVAWALLPMLLAGCAGTANNAQPANAASTASASVSATAMFKDRTAYFSQRFDTDALGSDVKEAVIRANLPPVSFGKIVVHTRDQIMIGSQTTPGVYTTDITFESAGHGLVRRMQSVQSNGFEVQTRFDLQYRGYVPFMSQEVPDNAAVLPPVIESRKVIRFETATDGHTALSYLHGASGKATSKDPSQFVCDSGRRYDASQVNPAMQGQALELDCQAINGNGIVTSKLTFAYLETYGIALPLHIRNTSGAFDSTITGFTVQ